MRLFDFLSFFDESTMVKIIDNDVVLCQDLVQIKMRGSAS